MAGTKEGAAKRKAALQAQQDRVEPVPEPVQDRVQVATVVLDGQRVEVEVPPELQQPLGPVSIAPELPEDGLSTPVYHVGKVGKVRVGARLLRTGEIVPNAHTWPRLETWVNTGRIVAGA